MDAVQRMRKKAQDKGALKTNEQQKVETQVVEQKTVIVVQPANPEVIYVPVYSPTVVYPPPVYPYPPIYYPPPPPPGAAFMTFTAGVMIGAAVWGGSCCGCGWGSSNTVNVNVNNNYNKNTNVKAGNVQHNSAHRGGAPYSSQATANKYGGSAQGGSSGRAPDGRRRKPERQQREPQRGRSEPQRQHREPQQRRRRGEPAAPARASAAEAAAAQAPAPAAPAPRRAEAPSAGGSGGYSGSSAKSSSSRGASSMSSGSRGGGGGGGEAAEAGGERHEKREREIFDEGRQPAAPRLLAGLSLALPFEGSLSAAPEGAPKAKPPVSQQRSFSSPKEAADALIAAADPFDVAALKAILGPDGQGPRRHEGPGPGQESRRQRSRRRPARRTKSSSTRRTRTSPSSRSETRTGRCRSRSSRGAGSGSSTRRRGARKCSTAASGGTSWTPSTVCRDFVEAQHAYALEKHDDSAVNQYAQKIVSTPGKQDGLAWQQPRRDPGRAAGRRGRPRDRRGLHEEDEEARAVPRLLLQGPEGPGPGGAAREDRLRRQGRDDRRLRPRRGAGRLPRDRREDLHREPRRRRLREGPRAEDARAVPGDGALQPGQDVEAGQGAVKPGYGAPPMPSESARSARARSSTSGKLRSTVRWSRSSSSRSRTARSSVTAGIRLSSIALRRRAI